MPRLYIWPMANVIGDIAGNYDTLMALIKKMPDEEVISVGDMLDRGPRSKEVLDWFMSNGRAIKGNHEHLAYTGCRDPKFYRGTSVWLRQGGLATLSSFGGEIPDNYLDWIDGLPLYLEIDGCLISHAFLHYKLSLEQACNIGRNSDECSDSIMWNRGCPERRKKWRLQVAGHNSHYGLKRFSEEEGEYAICLDTSRDKVLTGVNLTSGEIYQQEYID